MAWTKVQKGRYRGKTIPQIIFSNPDYFFWAYEKKDFFEGKLLEEAREVYRKATSIKIPQPQQGEKLVVEYAFMPSVGTFCDFELVPFSRPPHKGSTPTYRKDVIDMSIPRQRKRYDKLGYKLFLKSLKVYIFGLPYRFTKKNCENFFEDDDNFVL